MRPAQPARCARLANAMPRSVVYSATPASTGTRPATASTAARSTCSFSSASRELFSPRVPSMTSPRMPASRQASICRAVAARSKLPSALNSVIKAGKTPFQSTVAMIFAPHLRSGEDAASPLVIFYILYNMSP